MEGKLGYTSNSFGQKVFRERLAKILIFLTVFYWYFFDIACSNNFGILPVASNFTFFFYLYLISFCICNLLTHSLYLNDPF